MRNDKPPGYDSDVGRQTIIWLYIVGFPVHRIASLFDCNQGRISEALNDYRADLVERS